MSGPIRHEISSFSVLSYVWRARGATTEFIAPSCGGVKYERAARNTHVSSIYVRMLNARTCANTHFFETEDRQIQIFAKWCLPIPSFELLLWRDDIYKHDGRFVGGLTSVRFVSKPDFVAYACKPAAQSVKATTVKCMLTIDIFVSTQWRINRIIGCFDESAELRRDKTDVSRVAQSLSIGLRLTTYVLPSCVSVSKRINLLPVWLLI